MFMVVTDSSTMNITASAGEIKVKRQHPPGSRAGIKTGTVAGWSGGSAGSDRAYLAG